MEDRIFSNKYIKKKLRLRISQKFILHFGLLTCLLPGSIISLTASFSIAIFILLIGGLKNISIDRTTFIIILPLVLIVFIGVFSSSQLDYTFGKDLFYSIKPIIFFFVGVFLFRLNIKSFDFLGILLLATFIGAVVHIFLVVNIVGNGIYDIRIIREEAGAGSLISAFMMGYLLKINRFHLINNVLRLPYYVYVIVIGLSFLISFSRTTFVVFILVFLSFKGYFTLRLGVLAKNFLRLSIIAFIMLGSIYYIDHIVSDSSMMSQFTSKILRSMVEISSENKFSNEYDIIKNWRGYESYLMKREIENGSLLKKIFGFGYGKTIFIGNDGFLGELLDIPVFHNGFMQVKLKTGLIGLFLYNLFFLQLFLFVDKQTMREDELVLFFKGILVSIFISTLVITGIYNKSALDASLLILGYLLCLLNVRYNQKAKLG